MRFTDRMENVTEYEAAIERITLRAENAGLEPPSISREDWEANGYQSPIWACGPDGQVQRLDSELSTVFDGDEYRVCEACGDLILVDDGLDVSGLFYCDRDCANSDGWEQCEECGGWIREENALIIDESVFCSEACANEAGYERCDDCGEWIADGSHRTYWTHDERTICEDCYELNYFCCDDCNEVYPVSDLVQTEWYNYCPDCAEERGYTDLHPYGYTPALEFYGTPDASPYLGVELETDNEDASDGQRSEYCRELAGIAEYERVWLTSDSSLNCGVEVTSMPMTLDEHVNCGVWEDVRAVALANGYTSHDAGTCGLHVHVNRTFFGESARVQDACAYKLTRLLQRHERAFTAFSRRADTRWCGYQTSSDYSAPQLAKQSLLRKAATLKDEDGRHHSQALNLQHRATFEFRIFRGTLRMGTLYASLALVVGLCRLVKTHGEGWCENVGWYDLVNACIGEVPNEEAKRHLVEYLRVRQLI